MGFKKCLNSSQCVFTDWWCDGDEDCDDNSDEAYCGMKPYIGVFIKTITHTHFMLLYTKNIFVNFEINSIVNDETDRKCN